MGGRLDAVNVVDGDVAVVTSIGLDHQEYLGDTLEAIAREKAGIFRPGKTAVIGGREPSLVLEEVARGTNSPLKRLAIEYNYILDGAGWRYRGTRWDLPHLPAPALLGAIQFTNAATAIAALEEIAPRLNIPAAADRARPRRGALARPLPAHRAGRGRAAMGAGCRPQSGCRARPGAQFECQPGRGQDLGGVRNSRGQGCRGYRRHHGRLHRCMVVRARSTARGAAAERRSRTRSATRSPYRSRAADSVASACQAALSAAGPQDRIVVFGSFHTVGPALDWLESQGLLPPTARPEYTSP